MRALLAHLDTPLVEGDTTRVRYLNYANAESLAAKLFIQFADEGNTENKVKVRPTKTPTRSLSTRRQTPCGACFRWSISSISGARRCWWKS